MYFFYVCGQYCPSHTPAKIDLTIVDLGDTIHKNVSKYLNKDFNGVEAIKWAIRNGNTTKTGNLPGGLVELDFNGIELLTTAFLNAAIGQLYSHYDSATLNQHLKPINVAEEDRYLFKKVLDRAKEYFANKESFGNSAKDAIYGE